MSVFNKLRMIARNFGFECQRANEYTVSERRIVSFLKHKNIDIVYDVGANDGGYASAILKAGYSNKIVSFEPIPAVWDKLLENSRKFSEQWEVAPAIALSDRKGTIDFNIASNLVSSSMLSMNESHVNAQPSSATSSSIEVQTTTFDAYCEERNRLGRGFLKVDVQGAEISVLEGAAKSLDQSIVGVQTEMSIIALYNGQALASGIHDYLTAHGFELWDIIPGFRHFKTFRLMQYDGIYFKVE